MRNLQALNVDLVGLSWDINKLKVWPWRSQYVEKGRNVMVAVTVPTSESAGALPGTTSVHG